MKKIIRFMKSQEAFPGIITITNSIVVYFALEAIGARHNLKGTIIYFLGMETIAIVALVIGYIVWKKGGEQ